MKQFDESDLAKNAGGLFEAATDAPVTITKHGKPRFVVMSIERFESLADRSGSGVPLDVADMPKELGTLLDKGIEEHLRDR